MKYIGTSEKAMAPHSSTLAWKIQWTEEPGRLQSMGSLRVRHDWATHFHFSLSCIGEGNGNPPSVLGWRIPGMGEPGGLPSMGSHRVGHGWSDLAAAAAYCDMVIWSIELEWLIVCSSESGSSRFASQCCQLSCLSTCFDTSTCDHYFLSHYIAVRITWNMLLHITHLSQNLTHGKYSIDSIYR